jgi:hypothetical protein
MSAVDYVNRTVDMLMLTGTRLSGEAQVQMELALPGEGGQITTGIQKLAQRFLLELLTEKGSLLYWPSRGTDFFKEARLGYFHTPLDVLASISAALVDIEQNLQLEESETDPADERYASAEVLAVTLNAGNASVTIRVTSRAGTSRVVIQPLSVAL